VSSQRRSDFTSEGRVASDTVDQGGEDGPDTDTGTGQTDGGRTGAVQLGGDDDGRGRGLGNDATRLHGTADHARAEVGAGIVEEQAVADRWLPGGADNGALDGSWMELDEKMMAWARASQRDWSLPCDVDTKRPDCLAPMRATAPVILLATNMLWMDSG